MKHDLLQEEGVSATQLTRQNVRLVSFNILQFIFIPTDFVFCV